MRTIACLTGVLALTLCAAGPVAAQSEPKSQARQVRKAAPQYPADSQRAARPNETDGYREQLADKLPIGSQAWWDQMRREGRLGGETP